MFLPIGDEPNLRGTPIITYVLIGLNVAIFVLISWPLTMQPVDPSDPAVAEYLRFVGREMGVSARQLLPHLNAHDLFVFRHGFKPADPHLTDLLTSMFLHAGWLHLLGNMLFLWIFGDNVELHVGRAGYIALYLITGAAAVGLHAAFRINSMLPMVGASGAISGILGCYFLWFPRNQVRVLIVLFVFVQVVRIPARIVLGFYLIVENLLPFFLSAGDTGVAYGAHIGGFIGGLGSAALVTSWNRHRALKPRRAWLDSDVEKSEASPDPPTEEFSRAIADHEFVRAVNAYTRMSARERLRLPADEVLDLADWLVESGELDAGLAVLHRFVAANPGSAALPRAILRAGMIHLRQDRLPAAYQNFLAVLDLPASLSEVEGARAGLAEVDRREREKRRFRLR